MSTEYFLIGCGLFNCTLARLFAEAGHKVHIIEARDHIGGNCFDLIKGKRTPVCFKFTLFLSPSDFYERTQLPPDPSDAISGFLLNLRFMHGELTASTGVSYRTFSTDKSLEFEWDSYIRQFFKEHSLYFSEDL